MTPDPPVPAASCKRCRKPKEAHVPGQRGLECYVGEDLCWLEPSVQAASLKHRAEAMLHPGVIPSGSQWRALTRDLLEAIASQREALKKINALPSELAGDAWAIARAALAEEKAKR